jgi:predicted amino acid racemase
VFSEDKAREAAHAAADVGREQPLLARIQAPGDRFYPGHEGGFAVDQAVGIADRLDALPGVRFAGVTTFPALLFDSERRIVAPTPNLATLTRAARSLAACGRSGVEINAPGTTSAATLGMLAEAGATQVEPGHGLTGTTPLHAVADLPETPAVAYLTEVSHRHAGRAYCFGGGLYVDPVFPDYPVRALVTAEPTVAAAAVLPVEIPPPAAIDYYGMIDFADRSTIAAGDSVVFGFRPQAFATRAFVVGLKGVSSGAATPGVVCTASGAPAAWLG